jgi:hypothetical protein
VFNVREHPEGTVEIDGVSSAAIFTEVTGTERDELYEQLARMWSSYRMYERNAGRPIPVFRVATVSS